MKIIAILGQKGGPGKTTVGINFAVEAAADGLSVVLVDLDPQTSAALWADRRPAASSELLHVEVQSAQAARLAQVLQVAQRAGVELAILDTPGRAADAAIAAARAADLVLCPFRPSIMDLETMGAVRDLLTTAGNPRTLAVINAAPSRGGRHTEAEQALTDQGFDVAPVVWGQRNAFADAAAGGLAVREFEPGGKAAAEALELYRFTIKLLNQ